MTETREHVNRTAELCEMLWGFLQDLDRVRHLKRKPSVEKLLRVAHAVSQLSGAYIKAAEAHTLPGLEARLTALESSLVSWDRYMEGRHNGHDAQRA